MMVSFTLSIITDTWLVNQRVFAVTAFIGSKSNVTVQRNFRCKSNIPVGGNVMRKRRTTFYQLDYKIAQDHELWFQQDGATSHVVRISVVVLKRTFPNPRDFAQW